MRHSHLGLSLAAAVIAAPLFASSASAGTWLVTSGTTLVDTDLSHEGDDVIVEGAILYVNGAHNFASVTLRRSAGNSPGVLRHGAAFTNGVVNGCFLTVAGDVTIEGPARGLVGSQIDLWGWGFTPQTGPGAGWSAWAAAGGGHGGHGGAGQGTAGGGDVHGSVTQPTDFGSGGGNPACCSSGGWGGGAVHLVVGGELRVDGAIIVNGSAGGDAGGWGGGAGAGGSIWVECAHLTGTGAISADGGISAYGGAVGGGGGGGRISLNYSQNTFAGTVSARGGPGAQRGGAGSIYMRDTDEPIGAGVLIFDNGGAVGARTPWHGPAAFDGSMIVRASAMLGTTNPVPLDLTFTGDVTVESGGLIDLTGYGEAPQAGAGAGVGAWAASGGGYGGHGGAGAGTGAGGESYGSIIQPTQLGSGGGHPACCGSGGSGGGALHMKVDGQLRVDGVVTVDGWPGGLAGGWGGGAGSGGSIWIECGSLTGGGVVRANGGEGAYGNVGGGGGGGRVAIYCQRDKFAGQVQAQGGVGAQRGGAGSVYRQQGSAGGVLIFDNGGLPGAKTEWINEQTVVADVTVQNAAVIAGKPGHPLHIEIVGSLHVNQGGHINVNGYGYAMLEGSGAGCYSAGGAPGAGHGGQGGDGLSANCGGFIYGSATQPVDFGSGGGGTACCNPGGSGGGVIRLTVSEVLEVNGVISANGTPGIYQGGWAGGGGSGGSVWVQCNQLTGVGAIQAIGGAGGGEDYAGGGGGGRISICGASMANFSGLIWVSGGAGYQLGAPGSLYLNIAGGDPSVRADLDGNQQIDGADLGILLGNWGCVNPGAACGECQGADIDGSGLVDGADLGTLLGAWSMVR